MCSVCPSSRFTLRPAASFPPVASSADLLRCRRKSVKHGEDILEGEENWRRWSHIASASGQSCLGATAAAWELMLWQRMGIEFMVQFATDVDPDCQKVILSHKKGPRSLGYGLGNVCEKCDLYTAGFPRQPYSRLLEQVAVFNRVWVTFCFFAHRSLLSLLLQMRPT